ALWSIEKALQTDSCGLVLAWQNWLPDKVVRRLQLAAEAGETLGILFQHRISKYSQSSLCLEIKDNERKASDNIFTGAGDYCSQTEIVVLKARGNFRPLSVQMNLHQENLPLQQPGRYDNP
ncbi:MAG: hypothetical protein KJN90_09770, partial [Gammaproteobacteria bacterium]|nr:hypothetical protein [Gammaproteobacteria bacterium]